ncbi:hypothetical protein [Cupriavidus basilensis]|uniref:hypothetical protein n=1 Tax=Cupriavidus basilensis TaxID=68895 RepID=UPI00284F14FF|nr:hypothetical protein [Cupriavidus basilensis]MDR3381762.1 hypothetical protein [Cupriavidus basilensis]
MSTPPEAPDFERKILNVALSTAEAAQMVVLAGKAGTPIADYLGYQVRAGAWGHVYALHVAAGERPNLGQVGPDGDAEK